MNEADDNIALSVAFEAHKGQVDKAGEDYIFHPLNVASRCNSKESKIVALLHDVLEDTNVTYKYLEDLGFSLTILDALLAITKKDNEPYEDFIVRCGKNKIAREVKIYDLEDNMRLARLKELTDKDIERIKKYHKAYWYLKNIEI